MTPTTADLTPRQIRTRYDLHRANCPDCTGRTLCPAGEDHARLYVTQQQAPRPQSTTEDWRDKAECREEGPELFFPNAAPIGPRVSAAKAVCRRCPVLDQCLQWALATDQDHGIWGGKTADERAAMKGRSRRRTSASGRVQRRGVPA